MNPKKVRQLRKEANYHPSDERTYYTVNKSRRIKGTNSQGDIVFKNGTIELQDTCSRSLYKELKKELKGN